MSAPGSSGPGKTAEELLAQLLTEREYLSVLSYAKAHALESDDAVFFLVALLKIFAQAYDRILRAIESGEQGLQHIQDATDLAIERIGRELGNQSITIERVMNNAIARMAYHTAELNMTTGELRGLRDDLQKANTEATGVLRAYERIVDDSSGETLSQVFQRKTSEVLDRRIPIFDAEVEHTLVDAVRIAGRRLVGLWAAQCGLLILLLVIVLRK